MEKNRLRLWLLVLVAVTAAGCASARRGEPIAGPFPLSSPELVQGQKAFMQHCSQCHPGGAAGLGPALNDKPLPAFLMKYQVRRGIGAMPAFDKHHISGRELDNIISYLKALRRHG